LVGIEIYTAVYAVILVSNTAYKA